MLIAKRKSNAQTLIGYKKDFDSNDPDLPTKYYKLKIPNSHEETVKVLEADGESTELLMESYDKLDELRGRVTTQWNAAERFRQLYSILKDEARDAFDEIVDRDYPNNNDKTNANYEELKRKIITQMSDHVNPGDKIVTYLEQKVSYQKCKDDKTGVLVRPVDHLKRCKIMKKYGSRMHHTQGANYFDTNRFKTCIYNHFPQDWKDWLEQQLGRDPFDVTNPLDVDEICDTMQRKWYLEERPKLRSNHSSKRKKDDDDANDNNGGGDKNSHQGSRKRHKKGGNNYKSGGGNRSQSSHEKCSIPGHEKYRHGWTSCFLNPYNKNCDHEEAKKFYDEKARGNTAWYRSVYEGYHGNKSNNDGQGSGYQGRGSYRGRGYQGRGRGGGRGYHNGGRGGGRGGRGYQNQGQYNNQGGGNADGYHYQQGGGLDHQGYDQGYDQQGPPPQQESYHYGMAQRRPQAPNVPQAPPSSSQGNYSYQRGRI